MDPPQRARHKRIALKNKVASCFLAGGIIASNPALADSCETIIPGASADSYEGPYGGYDGDGFCHSRVTASEADCRRRTGALFDYFSPDHGKGFTHCIFRIPPSNAQPPNGESRSSGDGDEASSKWEGLGSQLARAEAAAQKAVTEKNYGAARDNFKEVARLYYEQYRGLGMGLVNAQEAEKKAQFFNCRAIKETFVQRNQTLDEIEKGLNDAGCGRFDLLADDRIQAMRELQAQFAKFDPSKPYLSVNVCNYSNNGDARVSFAIREDLSSGMIQSSALVVQGWSNAPMGECTTVLQRNFGSFPWKEYYYHAETKNWEWPGERDAATKYCVGKYGFARVFKQNYSCQQNETLGLFARKVANQGSGIETVETITLE
jgi:hypothetical protein